MRTIIKISAVFVLTLCLLFSLSCGKEGDADLWEDAVYTSDRELGTGELTFSLKVIAGDKTVVFTVHTDKENLGEILLSEKLVDGDNGPYGLYVKKVNGITADYDANGAWWGLNQVKDGKSEAMQTGVDGVTVADGDIYELIYSK